MAYQSTFKRYETKYLLTQKQLCRVQDVLKRHMVPDRYGRTVIRNLYFDTDSYRLIRQSIEKPVFKEKLRLRSYAAAALHEDIFVELKRKYKGVVYKRRLVMPQNIALQWLAGDGFCMPDTQIGREIEYFRSFYGDLKPTVFLSYARQAWYCPDSPELRITFDDSLLCRQIALTLAQSPSGTPLLPDGMTLMEVKTSGGMPLWLTELLTKERIFKTSFSKYGTAYITQIFPDNKGV